MQATSIASNQILYNQIFSAECAQLSIRKYGVYPGHLPSRSKCSKFNQFISVFEQICEVMGQLCFAMDLLIGQKIALAKGSNSLQPKGAAAGNLICEQVICHR